MPRIKLALRDHAVTDWNCALDRNVGAANRATVRPLEEKVMEFALGDLRGSEMAAKNPLNRRFFIGGSDARIIMSPDEAALIRRGRKSPARAEPEDRSGNLIVQLGLATEARNRAWWQAFRATPPLLSPPARENAPRFLRETRCRRFGEHFRSPPENPGFPGIFLTGISNIEVGRLIIENM
jgi:hypothetical protein